MAFVPDNKETILAIIDGWTGKLSYELLAEKLQLELDMEQQNGSKQEKEYVKAIYCHPAYLTCMHSTS